MSTSEYPAPGLRGPRLAPASPASALRSIPAATWIVAGVVIVAAVVRFATISSQSFWTDEALSAYEAGLPFGAMLHTVLHVETTPPLYFVVAWFWEHIFGHSELALRSLSALAGLGLIPIAYLCGRELTSRRAGVIAAMFVAINPFMIWYSQEARAYMLLALFSGASLLWFIRARRDPGTRNLLWWAVWSALAVLTHFFAGFLIAPEAAWLLWLWRRRGVVIAIGAVAAVQLAMIPFAYSATGRGTGWIGALTKHSRIEGVPLDFTMKNFGREIGTAGGLVLIGAILVALIVVLRYRAGDDDRRAVAIPAVITAAGVLVPLGLAYLGKDFFISRNLTPVWPAIAVAVAIVCALPRARTAGAVIAGALLVLFAYASYRDATNQLLERPDWDALARLIGPAPAQRLIVVAGGTSADPLKLYLPGVTWIQLQDRPRRIGEIDIVGSRYPGPSRLPRGVNIAGTTLLTRVSLDSWVYARWRLPHPIWVDIHRGVRLSRRYFRRMPWAVLALIQNPTR